MPFGTLMAQAAAAAKDSLSAGMSKQVAKVLNRYLGYYIEGGIDAEKFEVDVFSGTVKLRDLKVSADAFTTLGLPVTLVASYIGEIDLDIPFTNLKTEPIIVTVRRVFITLSPDSECDKRTMERLQLGKFETDQAPACICSQQNCIVFGAHLVYPIYLQLPPNLPRIMP